MREFTDSEGRTWQTDVAEASGNDYKGRFHLVMTGPGGEETSLVDVCWNSRRTAERTLATMSVVELRRRLRSAAGRAGVSV